MCITLKTHHSKPKAPYAYFWFSFANYAGTLYSGNLKALLDEDLEFGDDLPHSIAYTIILHYCNFNTRIQYYII